MTVHLTAEQAAALGLVVRKPARTTRRTLAGPYHTRCAMCSEEFTVRAAEDRHVVETKHARYELVL